MPPPSDRQPHYSLAAVKAAAVKERIHFAGGSNEDLQRWNIAATTVLQKIKSLTHKDYHETVSYTHDEPALAGVFDVYIIRRTKISASGIPLENNYYLKFKLVTPETGDLIIVISAHPSGF